MKEVYLYLKALTIALVLALGFAQVAGHAQTDESAAAADFRHGGAGERPDRPASTQSTSAKCRFGWRCPS